jgi:hypothetical protein
MGVACGTYWRQERCIQGLWWGDLREKDDMEDLRMDGRIELKLMFKKWDGESRTALTWLRIGTGGGLL